MQQHTSPPPLLVWISHPQVWRRLMPYAAGVLVCILCFELGLWQLNRAAYKQALQEQYDEAQHTLLSVDSAKVLKEWQHVQVQGRWVPDQTVFVDNRTYQGQAGFDVLTPLRLTHDGSVVVVNRGWVATGPDRRVLPKIETPETDVMVEGLTRKPGIDTVVPMPSPIVGDQAPAFDSPKASIWLSPNLNYYEQRLVEDVAPVLILQDPQTGIGIDDGLVRNHPGPQFEPTRHQAYALQWFSFAALFAALTGGFAFKNIRAFKKKALQPRQ